MSELIKDNAKIVFSLFMFVIFMSFVSYLGAVGFDLLSITESKRGLQKELVSQREMAIFNDTTVTHDDIIIASKKYKKQYRILVQPFETYTDINVELTVDPHDYYLTELDSDASWDKDVIDKKLSALEGYASVDSVRYSSKLIRDKNTDLVTTLLFTKQ